MGIYIIKSLHSDWIRVGHQVITDKRPSVYYRFIGRGFYTVVRPQEIENKVDFNDLQLIYWFSDLNKQDERRLLKKLRILYEHNGKWYKYENINDILNIIHKDYNVVSVLPSIDELNNALKWCEKMNEKKSFVGKRDLKKLTPILFS